MKRMLALALVLIMLFSASACRAENDYSNMTLDELTETYREFMAEFLSRTEERYGGSLIFEGDYVAGKDIKPGRYQFICVVERGVPMLHIAKPNEMGAGTWVTHKAIYVRVDSTLPQYFVLEDGMRLEVKNCFGVLIPADLPSKPDWAP